MGELSMAALVTMIFGRWASIKTFVGGMKGGAIIGLLAVLSFDMIFYGTTTLGTLTSTLVDPLIGMVRAAVAGGVIGWILGRGE